MHGPTRHMWSELVDYETLAAREVLAPLARRRIQLVVAVTPELAGGLAAVVGACRDAGCRVAVWPMLDDAAGRWASRANAAAFADFARAVLDELDVARLAPDELAIDLEAPIDVVRAALRGRPRRFAERIERGATATLAALCEDARARGLRVSAAVPPPAAAGRGARGWQRLLAIPVERLALDRVSAMAYTSLFEGYSRGFLRRDDAEALLATCAADVASAWGASASVSLGCVGGGALGDERAYRDASELARDVAIARAAGVDDLALFDLAGCLQRPPVAQWLDALDAPPAGAPLPSSARARLVGSLIDWSGALAELLGSRRRRRPR